MILYVIKMDNDRNDNGGNNTYNDDNQEWVVNIIKILALEILLVDYHKSYQQILLQ